MQACGLALPGCPLFRGFPFRCFPEGKPRNSHVLREAPSIFPRVQNNVFLQNVLLFFMRRFFRDPNRSPRKKKNKTPDRDNSANHAWAKRFTVARSWRGFCVGQSMAAARRFFCFFFGAEKRRRNSSGSVLIRICIEFALNPFNPDILG